MDVRRDPIDPVQRAARRIPADVDSLARDLLSGEGTRLLHVRTAGFVASRIARLFDPEEAELLVAAATLHDIGYSSRIAHTGFHPLDGAIFLRDEGYPERLAALVAHHSLAIMTAAGKGVHDLAERFPREESLLADALAYADMHSAPDGRVIPAERRLADIARRHNDTVEVARAQQLRAALVRVGAALLDVPSTSGTHPTHTAHRRVTSQLQRWGERHEGSGPSEVRRVTHAGARAPAAPVGDGLHGAFDEWWYAEAQYTRELESFHPESGGALAREAALRLARLRARADAGRDGYFRRALS